MTAKELYNLKNSSNEGKLGKFDEFISEFEEKQKIICNCSQSR